jgi:hypothetical protein
MVARFWPLMIGVAAAAFYAIPHAWAGDPNPAMSQPDMVAWRLFATVSRPATPPDKTNALFETWASDEDTFNSNPKWPETTGGKIRKTLITRLGKTGPKVTGRARWGTKPQTECERGMIAPCVGKETLRNRPAFDFIVNNKLYSRQGLAAAFGTTIRFPIESIEVKAEWIPVTQLEGWNGVTPGEAAALYHVNTTRIGGKTVSVALVALHVISKEVPDWTWATFEHWKNPGRCDETGCHDKFGAVPVDVKFNVKPNQGYASCVPTDALKKLFSEAGLADVWLNYCLKGSQTNFITSTGEPTLLGNSVSEAINAGVPSARSSCMTCHTEAAADKDGNEAKVRLFVTGPPQLSWFTGSGSLAAPQYRQADFVWAVPLCAVAADGATACAPPPDEDGGKPD